MATGMDAARDSSVEHRLQILLDSIIDAAIYLLDREGFVTSWNAGAERITGYQAGEIIGEHFSRFFLPEDRQRNLPQHILAQAMASDGFEDEGWRIRRDGSRFWALSGVHAIRGEDGAANLTVLQDLCHTMKFGSLCALGGFTPYPVMSALKHFKEDFGPAPTRLVAAE